MIGLNFWIGVLLVVLGGLALLLSFAIAVKQYLLTYQIALGVAGPIGETADLLKVFLELLKGMLKAPPALAFLVGGLLVTTGGILVLHFKPL
ncbi:MAG TPA: hypothetical protein VKT50_07960 [Candidatus Acidoferrales bacterium]|nr:hypothetical protein [Candidatus Acidoferrales bacterium]